ncbi:hypothetical protein SAMD00023353_5100120 [Rosellinia necatrix]|uniref:Uncharacterized protein n=1 Tax=Rosellinia necatrix TaxID=77044 RepID=A0A1S8A9S2_ROSNE|nr:hypothetical protein SAMD00023353_5100120 [Rosellinia necatrix]
MWWSRGVDSTTKVHRRLEEEKGYLDENAPAIKATYSSDPSEYANESANQRVVDRDELQVNLLGSHGWHDGCGPAEKRLVAKARLLV